MSRSRQPSIAFSIASGRASSTKNSAGPPMPNEVREASASFSLTPGSPRSQASLDFVRQLIAQLLDVARAHQKDQVVRADDLLESFLRSCEVADVNPLGDLVREVGSLHAGDVVLAGAVDVEHVDTVRALERTREVVHQCTQSRIT